MWSWHNKPAARALAGMRKANAERENRFFMRICYMFSTSKCWEDWYLGQCTFWAFAKRKLLRNAKFRFYLFRRNKFFSEILFVWRVILPNMLQIGNWAKLPLKFWHFLFPIHWFMLARTLTQFKFKVHSRSAFGPGAWFPITAHHVCAFLLYLEG